MTQRPKTGTRRAGLASLLQAARTNQRGVALPIVLIVLTFGSLVVVSLLTFSSTLSRATSADLDSLLSRYAADAGTTDFLADLLEGEDALDGSYSVPTPTVNGYAVSSTIATPVSGTEPSANERYFDPGVNWGLSSLGSLEHYYLTVDGIQAGTDIRVNWDFTPAASRWRMRLHEGGGPPVSPAAVVIASDDFETGDFKGGSGWLADWTTQGNIKVDNNFDAHEGSAYLVTTTGSGYGERTVDLTGETDVRLQFWAKVADFEDGDFARVLVSSNGVDFTVVHNWYDGEDDNVYRFEDIDLSSFAMSSEFWIVVDAEMSNAGDHLFIDTMEVVSQPVTTLLADRRGTASPATLFLDGASITGGQYTIDFFNDSSTPLASSAYSASGSAAATWVHTRAFQDYVIASTAGDATLTVYVRQAPGPTSPTTGQQLFIHSWNEP